MKYFLTLLLFLSITISYAQVQIGPIKDETITTFVALQHGPEQNPYDTTQITFVTCDTTTLDVMMMSYPAIKVYTYTIISISGEFMQISDTIQVSDTMYFTGNNSNTNMITYTPHTSQYKTLLKCFVKVSVGFLNTTSFSKDKVKDIVVINNEYQPTDINEVSKTSFTFYNGELKISSDEVNKVEVFNTSGQLVYYNSGSIFNLSNLPTGIYIFNINGKSHKIFNGKL